MFRPTPLGLAPATLPTLLPAFLRIVPAVHELRAPPGTAAHAGLAFLILAAAGGNAPILWVSPRPDWYAPGLAWNGIDPARGLFAQADNDAQALGAAEIALRGGIATVLECADLSRLAARRLALAAKTGGALGLVLRHVPARTAQDSSAFASRWLVHPAPGTPGAARFSARLLYAKGAMPADYLFERARDEEEEEAQKHGRTPLAVAAMRRA